MTLNSDRPVTVFLPSNSDVLAPDGSEIRILVGTGHCSMAHGTLPAGSTSLAIVHRTVEEVWYGLDGEAEIWRKQGEFENVVTIRKGTSLSLPVGVHFQFRTIGFEPFRFLMVTMPPWPGADEAVFVQGKWESPVSSGGE